MATTPPSDNNLHHGTGFDSRRFNHWGPVRRKAERGPSAFPARRFPGVQGGAAYIFWAHMVSNGIQGLGLSDDLLKHYKKEIGEMALGILDGEPYDSPIHEGILLTCMIISEMLPYVDSDKSEFSGEVFEGFLRDLADEINEEEREPSKRGPSAFILAPLIETELSLPLEGEFYSASFSSG